MTFYFFSGVKFTTGIVKGLIYNINNGQYKQFDLDLFALLTELNGKNLEFIRKNEIEDFVRFMIKEGWGFFTFEPLIFAEQEEFFDQPNLIDNCIIDYDSESFNYDLNLVLNSINHLRCKAVLIRIYSEVNYKYIKNLKTELEKYNFEYYQLIVKLIEPNELLSIDELGIHIHVYNWSDEKNKPYLKHTTTSISNIEPHLNCGFVNQFSVNLKHYMESRFFNSCLNAKVGIDVFGNIKNCPSDKIVYGNVNQDDIFKIVKSKDFQKKWHIKKDSVNTCKVCEYRYVCTDCRVFTVNNELLEKPKNCNYDPYTGSWNI